MFTATVNSRILSGFSVNRGMKKTTGAIHIPVSVGLVDRVPETGACYLQIHLCQNWNDWKVEITSIFSLYYYTVYFQLCVHFIYLFNIYLLFRQQKRIHSIQAGNIHYNVKFVVRLYSTGQSRTKLHLCCYAKHLRNRNAIKNERIENEDKQN